MNRNRQNKMILHRKLSSSQKKRNLYLLLENQQKQKLNLQKRKLNQQVCFQSPDLYLELQLLQLYFQSQQHCLISLHKVLSLVKPQIKQMLLEMLRIFFSPIKTLLWRVNQEKRKMKMMTKLKKSPKLFLKSTSKTITLKFSTSRLKS